MPRFTVKVSRREQDWSADSPALLCVTSARDDEADGAPLACVDSPPVDAAMQSNADTPEQAAALQCEVPDTPEHAAALQSIPNGAMQSVPDTSLQCVPSEPSAALQSNDDTPEFAPRRPSSG